MTSTEHSSHLDAKRYRTRDDMLGGARRMIRSLPGYAAETAELSLSDFRDLAREIDAAQTELVVTLVVDQGWTWAMVGAELGVTRTAAQKRYGQRVQLRRHLAAQ